MLNQEDKKQMVEIVGEALEGVVLPQFQEIRDKLKEHDKRFDEVDKRLDDMDKRFDAMDDRFDDVEARLEKVEKNTEVYPYDKEYVDEKLANHETRISKLELKKA